jgi:GT2 family glycosyltransferase
VYVIELDHDDMLTDNAVDEVKKAFDENPDVGMVYSNCASIFSDGSQHRFNDEFWKDRYRETEYHGKKYLECINPDIYDRFGPNYTQQFGWFLTVGPNHIRAYRTDLLHKFGGYNRNLPVADDWDLYARAFLRSKCMHINKMLYLYRFHDAWQNTTFTKNKSIQDHLELGRRHYEHEFIEFNDARLKAPEKNQSNYDLSVVVLDWNTQAVTECCLRSIRQHYPSAQVILVQNGQKFATDLANVIVPMELNVGFAAGCNRGAMEATGNYLCFLNSDTVVGPGLLEKLIGALSDPKVGIVGPYASHAKPPQGHHPKDDPCIKETLTMDVVCGVCLVLRRELFIDVGGFDTQFCNFEDDDICCRVRAKGLKCLVVGKAWIEHSEHASFISNNINYQATLDDSREKFYQKWPKVVVIALTLNEIKALPNFFAQFRGITDQFAILDSGSTDGTIEWAAQNGVKCVVREFTNFAEQRNFAIQQFSEDAKWIVMFDPDERLDSNTLKYFAELLRSPYDIIYAPLSAKNYDGSVTPWIPKPFLFRNKPEIKWVFPVHEKLIGSCSQAIIKNALNTHCLDLHDPSRRQSMGKFYDSLGQDGGVLGDWPILSYNKREDPRIKNIYLGPPISVIIPTYNRPALLHRAVESALAQDYVAQETLVIGDCCPQFKAINGCRCFNLPSNHGAGGAVPRNYGLILASNEWIAYLDDDNTLKPDHLSTTMSEILKSDADFGISSMQIGDKVHICDRMERGHTDTSCVIHKRDLIRKFGWWKDRTEATYAHDWEIVSRWANGGAKFIFTKIPTLMYNADTSGQKEFLDQITK